MSQLPEEQRQQLKAFVIETARAALKDRNEIKAKSDTMRAVWQALISQPTWSIVENDRPQDMPSEHWSMVPVVKKQ